MTGLFSLQDRTAFVTGVALPVDGGFSATTGLTTDDWTPLMQRSWPE